MNNVVGCQKSSEYKHVAIQELMEGKFYKFQSIFKAVQPIMPNHVLNSIENWSTNENQTLDDVGSHACRLAQSTTAGEFDYRYA